MTSQVINGLKTITINILPNISKYKENQTMKYGQVRGHSKMMSLQKCQILDPPNWGPHVTVSHLFYYILFPLPYPHPPMSPGKK